MPQQVPATRRHDHRFPRLDQVGENRWLISASARRWLRSAARSPPARPSMRRRCWRRRRRPGPRPSRRRHCRPRLALAAPGVATAALPALVPAAVGGISSILTPLAAGASLIGTGVQAIGQIKAGNEQATALSTNAQIQQENATIATGQAQGQAAIQKQNTEIIEGNVAAGYGAAGIDPTEGSPLDVMAGQAANGELQRQLALYTGSVGATSATNQANILTYEAGAAQRAGTTGAAGTILSGIAKTAYPASTFLGGSGAPAGPSFGYPY